jgi:hypothetical protein
VVHGGRVTRNEGTPQVGIGAALTDLVVTSVPGWASNALSLLIFSKGNRPEPYRLFSSRWCGPGGAGATTGVIDAACKAHDLCYDAAHLSATANTSGVELSLNQAAAAQACNQALYDVARSNPNEWGSISIQKWLTTGDQLPIGGILAPGTEAVPW